MGSLPVTWCCPAGTSAGCLASTGCCIIAGWFAVTGCRAAGCPDATAMFGAEMVGVARVVLLDRPGTLLNRLLFSSVIVEALLPCDPVCLVL